MQSTIYIDREDFRKVEEEEKNHWVKDILLKIGLPLDDVWPNDEITVEEKIKLRRLLAKYDVIILDDGDRGVEIYVDDEIIARWNKPTYKLRTDINKIDPKKKLFAEMIINTESIFDGEKDDDDTDDEE